MGKRKPALRFKGFEGEWDEYILHSVIKDFIVPMRDKPKEFSGKIPWTRIEDIEGKYINGSLSGQYVSEDTVKKMNLKIIPKDSLIVSASATFGVVAIVTTDLTTNQTFIGLVPKDGFDLNYLYSLFQSSTILEYMKAQSAGSTIFYISRESFENMPANIPQYAEQNKVGCFFKQLDALITQQQRKYDSLLNVKKSMLEKMFPKDGADVPEIRFKGFEGKWGKANADGIFFTTTDKNHPELPVLSASQEYGMIKRDESGINISHDKQNEVTYKRVLPGQFVIHLRSFQGGFAHSKIEGITSPAYTILDFKDKEKHYDYFWKYIFSSKEFIKRLEKVTYGIRDGRSISYNDFLMLSFTYPTYEEQYEIGNYFKHLDTLLTQHQKKLDHLNHIKSALLEKMFVSEAA